MGRGDKRTKRGKRWRGSFGVSRPKNTGKPVNVKPATETVKAEKES
jgi:ribosomal small subunit protein bTHX